MPSIFAWSTSIPTTWMPVRANSHASGRPTYPMPLTAAVARRSRSLTARSSACLPRGAALASSTATVPGPLGGRLRLRLAWLCAFLPLVLPTLPLLALSAFLGPLLSVMPDDTLAHTALLNPGDHILQPLVDLRIVDDASQRPLAAVHLAQDRVGVGGGAVDLLQEGVGVRLVVHEPADQSASLLQTLCGLAQGCRARPQVLDRPGTLAVGSGQCRHQSLVAVQLLRDRPEPRERRVDVLHLLADELFVGEERSGQTLSLLAALEGAPERRQTPLQVRDALPPELGIVDHLLHDPSAAIDGDQQVAQRGGDLLDVVGDPLALLDGLLPDGHTGLDEAIRRDGGAVRVSRCQLDVLVLGQVGERLQESLGPLADAVGVGPIHREHDFDLRLPDVLGELDLRHRADLHADQAHRRSFGQAAGVVDACPVFRLAREQSLLLADRHDADGEQDQTDRHERPDADLLRGPRELHLRVPSRRSGNGAAGARRTSGPRPRCRRTACAPQIDTRCGPRPRTRSECRASPRPT